MANPEHIEIARAILKSIPPPNHPWIWKGTVAEFFEDAANKLPPVIEQTQKEE